MISDQQWLEQNYKHAFSLVLQSIITLLENFFFFLPEILLSEHIGLSKFFLSPSRLQNVIFFEVQVPFPHEDGLENATLWALVVKSGRDIVQPPRSYAFCQSSEEAAHTILSSKTVMQNTLQMVSFESQLILASPQISAFRSLTTGNSNC